MSDKPMLKPSNGDQKMAAQIDEIYSKFHMIENLLGDLTPAMEKVSKDLQPTIRDFRIKYERDETLDLIMKVGDNIPVFLQLFDMMKVAQGLMEDMMPAVGKVMHDVQPVIKDMRERFEREETLELIYKLGDDIPIFLILLNLLGKKEMHYLIRGADKCAIRAMQDIASNPVQPGIKNLISAVMDPEVQKGLIMLTKFAKYLPKSINEAIAETKALEEDE